MSEQSVASAIPNQSRRDTSHLATQDLKTLDVSKLHPLSAEVISRQATINIGTIGHVAHGKSTVVKAISGVQTVRFKNELERNVSKLCWSNPHQIYSNLFFFLHEKMLRSQSSWDMLMPKFSNALNVSLLHVTNQTDQSKKINLNAKNANPK